MQSIAAELEISVGSSTSEAVESSDKSKQPIKKGNIFHICVCDLHNLFVVFGFS